MFPFRFTEPLIMHNLTFTQELDNVGDVGVIAQTEDVIVSGAGFLLWHDRVRAIKYLNRYRPVRKVRFSLCPAL